MAQTIYILGKDSVPQTFSVGQNQTLDIVLLHVPAISGVRNFEQEICVNLDGDGADVKIAGLYLCSEEDKFNLCLNVRHNVGGGSSNQLFKGIVKDSASVGINGLVYVARDAQKTKAFQQIHSLLLSPEATAQAQPQLEIYADDVECSHGATCGSLNDDELFYMRSRGIPEEEAKKLQILSFLSEVLRLLPEELSSQITDTLK